MCSALLQCDQMLKIPALKGTDFVDTNNRPSANVSCLILNLGLDERYDGAGDFFLGWQTDVFQQLPLHGRSVPRQFLGP